MGANRIPPGSAEQLADVAAKRHRPAGRQTAFRSAAAIPVQLSPQDVLDLQRSVGNRAVAGLVPRSRPQAPGDPVVQRVSANRVEYQHNRKVVTDDKGRVTKLIAPIDISFGTDEHSTYFAAERSLDQLAGLRTIRWEMNDDWWAAAYYHAYKGKKPAGAAKGWLERINKAGCGRMSASDGKSLTTDTKKKAPHFDARWDDILNAALTKGTGTVEDTETERRGAIAETDLREQQARDQKELARLGEHASVLAWDAASPGDTVEVSLGEALAMGFQWKAL